jgi:hypothetical protein
MLRDAGTLLVDEPLRERCAKLGRFAAAFPAGGALDGAIAKPARRGGHTSRR